MTSPDEQPVEPVLGLVERPDGQLEECTYCKHKELMTDEIHPDQYLPEPEWNKY